MLGNLDLIVYDQSKRTPLGLTNAEVPAQQVLKFLVAI